MSGSKTVQTSEQKQQQSSKPWDVAMPAVNRGLSAAGALYDQRMGQQFFPGQTYANFSQPTQDAFAGILGRAGNGATAGAQGMVNSTVRGDYLSQGNPYFQGMAQRITDNVLPSITAQWARAGRGTGNGEVVQAASRGLGDAIGQLAYQNYGDERGRQFQAAQMAPTLDYADFDRMRQVGAEYEAQDQKRIADEMARYQFEQDKGANALREYQGLTMPYVQLGQESSGTSSGTTTAQQRQSPLQTAIGAGLMGASLFTGGGPLSGMFGAGTGGLSAASQGMMAMNPAMLGGYAPNPYRPWG